MIVHFSLGLVSYKETPKVQAGGCSHSRTKASFQPGTPEMAACLQMLSKHGTIRCGVGWRFPETI